MEHEEILNMAAEARKLEQSGANAEALALYERAWENAVAGYLHQAACGVAHLRAHAADDLAEKLDWHQRALEQANLVTDDSTDGYYPSLHANLADVYLQMQQWSSAREHLEQAQTCAPVLRDNAYGDQIRGGIARGFELLQAERAETLWERAV